MRNVSTIGIIAVLLLSFGGYVPVTLGQTDEKRLVGTWDFSFPDGEPNVRIQLLTDAHWKLWKPGTKDEPVIQRGTWFLHGKTLFLRIEESIRGHIPPGIAYSFDIESVSLDKARLVWLDGKREVDWLRIR